MKKKSLLVLALVLSLTLALLAGCGSSKDNKSNASDSDIVVKDVDENKVITVGASATPHAEILEEARAALEDAGWELKVVIYDDYILPNKALSDGTIDANYFQHTPYLDSYNASNNTNLVSAAIIHYEPFGIYSNDVADLSELADGATIIIPADDSNETRALLLLQQEGLITLPEDASALAGVSTLDIVDNGGYNILAVQADTVAAQLENSDAGTIAVINGNYALAAGLKITDALATENADGDAALTYANIIACAAGDQNSEKITALISALQTDTIATFIASQYDGAVVKVF